MTAEGTVGAPTCLNTRSRKKATVTLFPNFLRFGQISCGEPIHIVFIKGNQSWFCNRIWALLPREALVFCLLWCHFVFP
jgi:hypothetical protein